ncbi:MAG: Holliday junction resolvase RuvX [Clostridiaceae bacterium]|nr:Holliday junction resolvase RuvX [Clostridiaceae bacterium]
MKVLGIDYGEARCGISVSDPLGITAQPLTTISEKDFSKQIEKIIEIAKEQNVSEIVVGLPKNMNGTLGERAEKSMEVAKILEEKTGIKTILWDERLSSASAHRALEEGLVSGKKRKGLVDKIASSIILQSYLDSKKMY